MFVDNYVGARGHGGDVINHFTGRTFDPGMRRPYLDRYDRPRVTVNTGRWTVERGERRQVKESVLVRDLVLEGKLPPVFNATALRKEEWLHLDTVVLRAARYRLQAWGDLAKANSFGGFNGMAKTILEHETMSDPGAAFVDMDGLSQGTGDAPLFQLEGLPLPITHSDFSYAARQLAISRNSSTPIDTVSGEAAGRRVAESIERVTIGNNTGISYGGLSTHFGGYGRTSAVYGYTNFTARLTKTNITTPTGTNSATTLSDVLAMRNQLYASKFYGPFMLYHSPDWDPYMDNDYYAITASGAVAPTKTLRERLRAIEGIQDVKRLDMLFSTLITTDTTSSSYRGPGQEGVASAATFNLIMVQMTPDVARAVNGMDITTVQWEERGGMKLSFKVMAIQVPQLRADYYSNCGILHGTTS